MIDEQIDGFSEENSEEGDGSKHFRSSDVNFDEVALLELIGKDFESDQ